MPLVKPSDVCVGMRLKVRLDDGITDEIAEVLARVNEEAWLIGFERLGLMVSWIVDIVGGEYGGFQLTSAVSPQPTNDHVSLDQADAYSIEFERDWNSDYAYANLEIVEVMVAH